MSFIVLMLAMVAPARADTPGIAGTLEQSSGTTAKEKVDFAASAVEEITGAVKTVQKLLDQAQKDKNTEAIECLSRKLTPMKALLEVSKTSQNSLQSFLAASDAVHGDLEYRKIAVALSKTRDFLAEAQACVGETGAKRGDAVVSVDAPETSDNLLEDVPVVVINVSTQD